jgi:DnaJ-domain-containing protein 1
MDRLFDRLAGLLRGLGILGGPGSPGGQAAAGRSPVDPLLREAQQEIEEYLRMDPGRRPPGPVPERLRQDFANFGLEPSASPEQVQRAHRQLLSRYHPDRFAGDPEKQRLATRITQILNASFRRIRAYRR